MESCLAIMGYLHHEYDISGTKAGPTVVVMSPLRVSMLAEALIHSAYGLFMIDHVHAHFLCYRAWIWRSIARKMRAGIHQYKGGQRSLFYPRGPC